MNTSNLFPTLNVGKWWEFTIKFLTPVILGITAIQNFIQEFSLPYEGYSITSLIVYGWSIALITLILGSANRQIKMVRSEHPHTKY